ncbi:conserved hypothetical protein [Thiomonas sp. CB3]|nr:conserved hypothetical protein [Thiomonas sp. CB3]
MFQQDNAAKSIEQGKLYTAQEVIDHLKISRQTLWRLEKRGQLVPLRYVRDLRFKGEDIQKLAGGAA